MLIIILSSLFLDGKNLTPNPSKLIFFDKDITINFVKINSGSYDQFKSTLLNQKGPKDSSGIRRYAVTNWNIGWSWPLDEYEKPILKKSKVKLRIILEFPFWIDNNSTYSEKNKWQKNFQILLNHEIAHIEQSKKTALKIKKSLKKLDQSYVDEKLVYIQANQMADRLVKANNQWDFNYDLQTNHGKNEGLE